MEQYAAIIFALALAALATILVLSIAGLFSQHFEFWPPPSELSWQHHCLRLLFRLFFYGLLLLTAVELSFRPVVTIALLFGAPLFFIGFGFALYWTNFLGWKNAFGEAESLRVTGIYQYIRNPVYVASMLGMVGWGIAVESVGVRVLLASWALLYMLAPKLEEPWLVKKFGSEFEAYRAKVPRYLGYVKRLPSR